MHPDSRRRLAAFVARVEQLESYSFFDGKANIAGMTVRQVDGEEVVEFHGPSDEATDAVLLHIRVLTQRDDISIGRMAELYDDPGVSQGWKDELGKWPNALNARLQGICAESPGGRRLTYGDLFEMVLHGRRGHLKATDRAYQRYSEWVTDEFERDLTKDTFFQIVIWVVAIAHNISAASREELARSPLGESA